MLHHMALYRKKRQMSVELTPYANEEVAEPLRGSFLSEIFAVPEKSCMDTFHALPPSSEKSLGLLLLLVGHSGPGLVLSV